MKRGTFDPGLRMSDTRQNQWRSQLDNGGGGGGGGGGGHIHIFLFTDRKNNQFQKKLIMQNTNI
jgi:hypothetical protein